MAGTLTLDDEQRQGPWDELIGRTVGSWRLVRLLGKGGMGAVYLAKQPQIGAQVAIKFLHPRFSGDRAVVERFFNEARAVNVIGHENILKILDFSVTQDGRYYFVMEYLAGKPLSAIAKPADLQICGPIVLQICRALHAAHERHIVHRDLKPDNVFLISQMGRKNFVKLVDFGIAKLVDPASQRGLTEAGVIIGTPEYMSPEQAAGRTSEIGRRSDIYSLGVVMYQLAAGRVPFSGPTTAETLVAHMTAPVPPLPDSVPAEYAAIIVKALAKKREERWQSMQELHDAVLACMQKLGISAELPPADPAEVTPAAPELPTPAPEVPLTATHAGEQPLLRRALDRALAPRHRGKLAAASVVVIALATWLAWPRAAVPPQLPPKAKPQPVAVVQPPPPPAQVPPPPAPVVVATPAPVPAHKKKPVVVAKKPAAPPPKPGPQTASEAARAVSPSVKARAEMAAAAEKAAHDDAALPKPPGGVKLFVVSEPLGATVTAAWSGKSASGQTPFVFRVRRGAQVTVSFSKQGYAPAVQEISAGKAQLVEAALTRQ